VDKLSTHIAANLKRLREARQMSQQRLSDASGVPRPTLAHLESGVANPALSLLLKVSEALQVRPEELWKHPVPAITRYRLDALPKRRKGKVSTQRLIVESNSGAAFERLSLEASGHWQVKPQKPGSRWHLYCEAGAVVLTAGEETCTLCAGEVAALSSETGFRAQNVSKRAAVLFLVSAPSLHGG
jgi:XRE family transcriptional regulator, regulator of sulfur utilization